MKPSQEFLRRINGDRRTVPKTHQRKPDPSDPWRYVCPECEGQVNRECSKTAFRCSRCKQFWQPDELLDKKGENDG